MIEIKFPANRPDIAFAMGEALMKIGGMTAAGPSANGAPVRATAEVYQAAGGDGEDPLVRKALASDANCLDENSSVVQGVADAELVHTAADSARRDMKGVAFDPAYCANAAEPFYGSGKDKGQWKTKRGVSAEVYATWYAAQLAGATQAASDEDSDPTPTVQTGAAFGAAVVSTVAAPAPRNAGEFMAWVAEKQTAGRLAQDVINAAYVSLGIRVQDLFPPTPENVIANNIASLHRELSAVAGA